MEGFVECLAISTTTAIVCNQEGSSLVTLETNVEATCCAIVVRFFNGSVARVARIAENEFAATVAAQDLAVFNFDLVDVLQT